MSLNKRKLTQDDLRKAMSEHKKKLGVIKKIDSSLAKYTDSGQLMCILCKSVVRNETIWPVHLNSKVHKENIELAKKSKLQTENIARPSNIPTYKRPGSPSEDISANKKIKGILKNSTQTALQTNSSLPADFFDNNSDQTNDRSVSMQKLESKDSAVDRNIDIEKMEIEKEKEKEKEKVKDPNFTVLPEGFFDDPVMDAKVRNVEYKNPTEEEWEKFQKEIQEETVQSTEITTDDEEETARKRRLDEIDEQMGYWSRFMDLVKHVEQVKNDRVARKLPEKENMDVSSEDVSSGEEVEYEEFMDWRSKTYCMKKVHK